MQLNPRRRWLARTLLSVLLATGSTVPVAAAGTSWPTYHLDNSRSGNDTGELPFNSVAQEWSMNVDGHVYAEPLVYGNALSVATENDSVYAINETTGAVLWQRSVGTAVPATNPPFFCGNVNPIGVTGTPVIDPVAGMMYVVGLTWDGSTPASIHYQLSVLNLNSNGAIVWQRSIAPTDPGPTSYLFDPLIENQRGALALANNTVYIPFGGRAGDCNNTLTGTRYRGWVAGAPTSGPTATLSAFVLPTPNGAGGFWATPGPAVDGATPASLYITSGNTFCSTPCAYDYGNTVLKLSSTLTMQGSFVPTDWSALNASDTDLGSVGPALLNNGLIFQVGKSGDAYLIRQSDMSQAYPAPGSFAHACPGLAQDAAFGGIAYAPPFLYVSCSNGVEALNITTSPTLSFSLAWHGPTEASPGGPPIVAGGVVWTINNSGTLYGLNPTTGAVVFSGSLGGPADHFATPAAGDGRVFVAATTRVLSFRNLGGAYHPLVPARILDTRYGIGHTGAVGPNQTINVQVTGRGLVPATGVLAAVLNVTVTGPTTFSHLIAFSTGVFRPNTSNLNFGPGETVPNLVEVGLGTGGQVSVYNYQGSTHVVIDVQGYVATPSSPPGVDGLYNALVPARILDTRYGTGGFSSPVGSGQTIAVQVAGQGLVPPTGAEAVVMNVTVTDPSNASFLTVWPDGSPRPNASNVNFVAGQTVPNRVVVKLGPNGKVDIFNFGGTAQVVADVNGWFTDTTAGGTGGVFWPLLPARLYDTRIGTGGISGPLGPGATISAQIAGVGAVPPMTATIPPKAVVLNVTVTTTTAASHLTVWPDGAPRPSPASDLNWVRGQTVPNLVVVGLGSNGKIDLYNYSGSTDWLIDVVGWYG